MTDVITPSELNDIIERFGQEATLKAQSETRAVFPGGWFPPSVIMALGLRESLLQNIRGGAKKVNGVWEPSDTDEGWLQVTNTVSTNAAWLKTVPGCPNGSWDPDIPGFNAGKVNALTPAHNPTFSAALQYTLKQVVAERAQAYAAGVKPADALRFVCAAHNAGFQGALTGYKAGNVDLHTTHGDYSQWVLSYAPQIAAWIAAKPAWTWSPPKSWEWTEPEGT